MLGNTRQVALTVLAVRILTAATAIASETEPVDWPARVLQVAQRLTGQWQVEGRCGEQRWTGRWSCSWVPGREAYFINCSGTLAGSSRGAQRLSLLTLYDSAAGQFVDVWLSPAPPSQPLAARSAGPPDSATSVKCRGPNELVWESSSNDDRRIVLSFRRVE